jgi:hypothetical protein
MGVLVRGVQHGGPHKRPTGKRARCLALVTPARKVRPASTTQEVPVMTKTQAAIVLAILGSVLLYEAVEPHGAVAAARAPAQASPRFAGADVAWPEPHEPVDTTPITLVESAGAPMHDSF